MGNIEVVVWLTSGRPVVLEVPRSAVAADVMACIKRLLGLPRRNQALVWCDPIGGSSVLAPDTPLRPLATPPEWRVIADLVRSRWYPIGLELRLVGLQQICLWRVGSCFPNARVGRRRTAR